MPPETRKRSASGAQKPAGQRDAKLFALLSLGCFLAGLLLLWLLIAKAEMLVRLGLEGKLYYLVLLPLGLVVAGFLFGVLRSFALYLLSDRNRLDEGRKAYDEALDILRQLASKNPDGYLPYELG